MSCDLLRERRDWLQRIRQGRGLSRKISALSANRLDLSQSLFLAAKERTIGKHELIVSPLSSGCQEKYPMLLRSLICLWLLSAAVQGQEIPAGTPGTQTQPPVAITGELFGVLQVEVPLPAGLTSDSPRVLVEESSGRLFYPAVSVRTIEVVEEGPRPGAGLPSIGRPGGLIDRVRSAVRGKPVKRQVPVALQVSALFRGQEPLELQLVGELNQRIRIVPSDSQVGISYQQLLAEWWKDYTAAARKTLDGNDFPKLIHQYLLAMLSGRLQLPPVELDPSEANQEQLSQPLQTLALLAAIEPLREEIFDSVLHAPAAAAAASLPLPPEPQWQPTVLPPLPSEPQVEALASRVPPECLYLRFGSFANYVWFQEIAERFGGDLTQAVLLRGFNYDATARMEQMLASKLTTIAKMFGDKLVGDMAIIGSDLYMKEGASVGVLFLATNPELFMSSLQSDRKAVLAKNPDASLTAVSIADKQVSLLSTPDNRVRSFLVQDGPYVFLSTSKSLVQRFLEVGGGGPSLADSPSFRWARSWMPDANQYSVFAYLSPEFFHRLVSPQYQIELRRRLSAIAHIEIAEVAARVAVAEGLGEPDLERLKDYGLLTPWFDQRTDGAQTLRSPQGWIDSLRGARGSFLPIADVEITSVSPREAEEYAAIANFYQDQWKRMDPLLLGLRRFRADGNQTEQVAVEAYIAPFEAEKYGWIARQLGAPTPVQLKLPADDAVSLQLHVRGGNTLGIVSDDYHLFGGIKDMVPPDPGETQGLIQIVRALKATPGYVGGWPKPGIIEQLPLGLGLTRSDYAGFSRMLGGLWRWTNGEFSLMSFDRSILDQAIPQLGVAHTEDLAQVRATVANLSGSQLATWINRQWYQRGWDASHGNAWLLDAIHQQLKVPSDQCLAVAEQLLDVRLQCPLGGTYEFQQLPGGTGGWWESTAWRGAVLNAEGKPAPPAGYTAPWIDWFRGGKVHVTQHSDSLALVGNIELELQPLAVEANPTLPSMLPAMSFDLFSLPKTLFGGQSAKEEKKPSSRSF